MRCNRRAAIYRDSDDCNQCQLPFGHAGLCISYCNHNQFFTAFYPEGFKKYFKPLGVIVSGMVVTLQYMTLSEKDKEKMQEFAGWRF